MRLFLSTLAMAISIVVVVADETGATPEENRASQIYESIANMATIRDDTLRRYALVMHGESVYDAPDTKLLVRPSVIVKLVDHSRQFEMTVRLQYTGQPPYRESTSSYLFDRGREKSFVPGIADIGGKWIEKPMKPKPASERKPWESQSFFERYGNFSCPGVPPIDSYLVPECTHGSVKPSRRNLENIVLREYELVSSKPVVGGIMETDWTWDTRWSDTYKIKIEFSAAVDRLPVRMHAQSANGKRYYASRIDWRRHEGNFLPYRVRFATEVKQGELSHMEDSTYRCFWLVGENVPDEFFESDNQILAVLDHFEIPHSIVIGDDIFPCEIGLPDDLFDNGSDKRPAK